jgi:cation transport regulator ChaC
MPQKDIASLIEKSIKEGRRLQLEGVVRKVAHCINSGLAKNYQVAVVFATASGQSPQEIDDLIEKLTSLSKTAIFTRISRIYRALWESRE